MHIDPHTVHQLLEKVRTQLRCPQCTQKVEVVMESLKVLSEHFAVLQLRCITCEAHILLYATLRQIPVSVASEGAQGDLQNEGGILAAQSSPSLTPGARNSPSHAYNVSTTLELDPSDMAALRAALREAGGRFSDVFEESL